MQQIKIFKGLESQVRMLEDEINTWLKSSGKNVVQIFGNMSPQSDQGTSATGEYLNKSPNSPSDVLLVVVYDEP